MPSVMSANVAYTQWHARSSACVRIFVCLHVRMCMCVCVWMWVLRCFTVNTCNLQQYFALIVPCCLLMMLLCCCCCCCRCRAPTSSQHTNANENVNSTTTATLTTQTTTTTTTTTWQRRRRFTDEWIAEFVWAQHEARQSRSECAHRIKANASADYSSDCEVNADADAACAAPESRSEATRSLHSMRMRSFCSFAQSLTHSYHSLTYTLVHSLCCWPALCRYLTALEHVKHFTFTCKQTVIAHTNCEPESFL